MIAQRRLHFSMAGHAIGLDRLQPDHRPGIAQRAMMRIGIRQERLVERVEIEARRLHQAVWPPSVSANQSAI
jgi:hypothetical protein